MSTIARETGDYTDSPIEYEREKRLPPLEWTLDSGLWVLTSIVAIGLTVYLIFYAYGFYWDRTRHTVLAMGWGIGLYHLIYIMDIDRDPLHGKIDFAVTGGMFAGTVAFTAYIFLNYNGLRNRLLDYAPFEYLLSGLLLLIIIEATRRAYGNPFVAVIIVFVGYAFFGGSLPGWLAHSGIGVQRLIEVNVLTLDGIYGTVPRVGTTWVAIFLIYAGLLEGYGALNMVFAAGRAAEKRFRAGTAQTAVVASILMGSINGSAVANTATTGSFTIPLMKDRGIRSATAAGIESAASSGGQVMPPIMGAAAFVMAGILNLPYIDVLVFALLPALLFYLSVTVSVQVISLKQDKIDNPESAEPDDDYSGNVQEGEPGTFRRGIPLVLSVIVLIYYLAVAQLSPMPSAIRAIGVLVAGQFFWQFYLSGFDIASLRKTAGATVQGLQIGAVSNAPIFAILGSIGILINLINVGSFTRLLTFAMLDQSGGSLLTLLFFAMIMSIMFGMGMPTVAAYILVAIFIGPAIVEFGLEQIYAHMFVFYFAILSALTPPVALGCAVACKIANTGFLRTCWDAIKIALPVFLLPYTFVLHRNLIVWDVMTPVVFVTTGLALFGLTFAVYNHIFQPLRLPIRILVGVTALAVLFITNSVVSVLGALVIIMIFAANYVESKKRTIGWSLPGSS